MKLIAAWLCTILSFSLWSQINVPKYDTIATLVNEHTFIQLKDTSDFIVEEGYLKNGLKDGQWTKFHKIGTPHITTSYQKGVKEGTEITIGSDGYMEQMASYRNNNLHGPLRIMFKGARVNKEVYYENGLENGTKKIYFSDGGIQEFAHMKKGKRDGLTTWFYSNGKKAVEYEYKEGLIHGKTVSYNEQGIVIEMGNYVNDSKEGKWLENYDNGKLKAEGNYKNGLKHGQWKQYNEDGKVIQTIQYKQGEVSQ